MQQHLKLHLTPQKLWCDRLKQRHRLSASSWWLPVMSPDSVVSDVAPLLHAQWCPINRSLTVQSTGPPKSVRQRLPPREDAVSCCRSVEQGQRNKAADLQSMCMHVELNLYSRNDEPSWFPLYILLKLYLCSSLIFMSNCQRLLWQVTNMSPILVTGLKATTERNRTELLGSHIWTNA
jgi:hypothetical protein